MTELPEGEWRRSTYCGSNSCLEIRLDNGRIAIRDSKVHNGPILQFDRTEWAAFLKGARNGEFDLPPMAFRMTP